MVRRSLAVAATTGMAVAVLAVSGCGEDGVSLPDRSALPTSLPSLPTSLPTVSRPSVPAESVPEPDTTAVVPVPPERATTEPEPVEPEPVEPAPLEPEATPEPEPVEPQPDEPVADGADPEETTVAAVAADGADDGAGAPWWPWVLAALVAAAAVVLLVVRSRRGAGNDAWDQRLARAQEGAAWVEESLVPQVLARTTSSDAATAWTAAAPRVQGVDQELHALVSAAPDEGRSSRAMLLRDAYGELVTAMTLDTTTSDTTTDERVDVDDLRRRRARVDEARADLRLLVTPAPRL